MTLPPRTRAIKRSAIKKKNRSAAEFKRIYGSKARVEFVKSLPCAACGVVGFSDNAHVLGNGGMGRKAGYETIAPLCGGFGCHLLYDDERWVFDRKFPDLDMQAVARETEKQWQLQQQEN